MSVTDYWLNPLDSAGSFTSFFGYSAAIEDFPHQLYSFFLSSLRDEDIKDVRLLWRFLKGMDTEWQSIYAKILALPLLYSPEFCPEEFLDYLREMVGITDDLDYLWGTLSTNEKRRLIRSFVLFIIRRGTRGGTIQMFQAMTGYLTQVRDYFYYRWIMSGDEDTEIEGALGREDTESDIYLVSEVTMPVGIKPDDITILGSGVDSQYVFRVDTLMDSIVDPPVPPNPSSVRVIFRPTQESLLLTPFKNPSDEWTVMTAIGELFGQTVEPYNSSVEDFRCAFENDAYVTDIRISGYGYINQDMCVSLAKFIRPMSERIYLRYLYFIDEFDSTSLTNWTEETGTVTFDDENDNVTLADAVTDSRMSSDVSGDEDWSDFCIGVKAMNNTEDKFFEIRWYVQDSSNYLRLVITPATPPTIPAGTWSYAEVVAGVPNVLDSGTLDWFDIEVDYFWRIVSVIDGANSVVRIYQDENLLIESINAASFTKGYIELVGESAGEVVVSYVETYPVPMVSDYVGPA